MLLAPRRPRPAPEPWGCRARRAPGRTALGVVGVAVVLLAAACGTSGRTLRDPIPGATAPPRKGASTTTSLAAFETTPDPALAISSSAWTPGGEIPRSLTCDGVGTSPPLTVSGAPEGAVELVVVVTDQDAAGFVHWVVAGIAPGPTSFPEGSIPEGTVEAPNSSGTPAWFPPCPPEGATHTYDVTVYALPEPSGLGPESTSEQLDAALSTTINSAAMTGTYTRL